MAMEEEKEKQQPSHKEKLLERMRGKYPEDDFTDDDFLYSRINEDFENNDTALSKYKTESDKLNELFNKDERSAAFIAEWARGGDPTVMLVKMLGEDNLREILDDPEKTEALAKANKEYLERISQSKQLEEEYNENLDKTSDVIDALKSEDGYSDEDIDGAIEFLSNIVKDGINGFFSKESFLMAMKAINHDKDVEIAGAEAEIKGRNTKIKEELRKPTKGDGTVPLQGGGIAPDSQKKRKSIIDWANEA